MSVSVLESCAFVVSQAEHVTISDSAIETELESYLSLYLTVPSWECDYHFKNNDQEETALYILALDALNFCFWELSGYEYEHLAFGLKKLVQFSKQQFNAQFLKLLSESDLEKSLIRDEDDLGRIPLLAERTRALNQVGRVLEEHFDSRVTNLILTAGKSARKLLELVTAFFPMFRDEAIYKGKQIFFYKRAQIFIGDIWGAFSGQSLGEFYDIDAITCFADYRVPQLLVPLRILQYHPILVEKVSTLEQLQPGSQDEQEIRAATIVAVDRMTKKLNEKGHRVNSIQMDWILWNRGEILHKKKEIPPHHRVKTIFY